MRRGTSIPPLTGPGKDMPETSDFRDVLRDELLQRCRRNPKYSIRAFGQFLGIENSALSKYLRGTRQLKAETIECLAARLGVSPRAPSLPTQYQPISKFSAAEALDWVVFATLELAKIKGFGRNSTWISRALGISIAEATKATNVLVQNGWVEIDQAGRWRIRSANISTANMPGTSASLIRLQRQILKKAADALEEIPIERRDQSSMTMAIATKRLPEARLLIKQFRRKLSQLLEGDLAKDEVYNLCISLYPLTTLKKMTAQRRTHS